MAAVSDLAEDLITNAKNSRAGRDAFLIYYSRISTVAVLLCLMGPLRDVVGVLAVSESVI